MEGLYTVGLERYCENALWERSASSFSVGSRDARAVRVGSPSTPSMNTRTSSKRSAIEPAKRQASKRARPASWEEVRAIQTSSDDDSDDCSGADELELRLFLAKTMRADLWPLLQTPPARSVALDRAGPWGAAASGVVIQDCEESAKGKGVFVTRPIGSGSFVGLYVGEVCTQRMRNLRHYDRQGLHAPTAYEQRDLDARTARLDSLTADQGKPAGGSHNGGAYVFSLLPEASEAVEKHLETAANDELLSCIDAEDPSRSSWGRYTDDR
jgi:hypothetical protein